MNGILLIDKPSGMTSHDVVALARRGLQTRGIGHAGTLDPMATGLLVLAVGEGRKLLRYLTLDDKRYGATVRLGVETRSLDADGEVVETAEVPAGLDAAAVEQALTRFVGAIEQRAPVVSAIKQGGVALHKRVRRGEQVEAPLRQVQCHALELVALRHEPAELELHVHCGKGFYVRSLARDLARSLGTVGHLTALRRTQSGHFGIADAVDMALLRDASRDEAAREAVVRCMVPIASALPQAPRLVLDAAGCDHARSGRAIPRAHVRQADGEAPAGLEPVLLLDERGVPIALARAEDECLRVVRGFNLE